MLNFYKKFPLLKNAQSYDYIIWQFFCKLIIFILNKNEIYLFKFLYFYGVYFPSNIILSQHLHGELKIISHLFLKRQLIAWQSFQP